MFSQNLSITWVIALFSIGGCSFLLLYLARVAKRIGLVDIPTLRKLHDQPVPLIGGVAVCSTLIAALLLSGIPLGEYRLLFFCFLIIFIVGVLDDYREISAAIKICIQIFMALLLVYFGDVTIRSLGEIFFVPKPYGLGWMAIPFTAVAIVGTINAFNMSDGHDGLAGSYFLIAFGSLALLCMIRDAGDLDFLIIVVATILPFLFFNFSEIVGHERQVFLGDAGSMALGLLIAFFLIDFSQTENSILKVAAAPWIIGMPLLDMMGVLVFRLRRRISPLKADRLHIHHLLLEVGIGKHMALGILAFTQLVFASIGVLGTLNYWNDGVLVWGCFLVLFLYLGLTSWIRRRISKENKGL
jgi:UDP-GlcNAc:undecaprenyl-phosphate/decaprenyl-phosphate GlcNAc-1-phosphate transferase